MFFLLLLVSATACADSGSYEWLVEIDEGWGSPEARQAVLKEEVEVLKSRLDATTRGSVELLSNGQIRIRQKDTLLEPLLASGDVALHFVPDPEDVTFQSIHPGLDSVLSMHSFLLPTGDYLVRESEIEEVLRYIETERVADSFRPHLHLAWAAQSQSLPVLDASPLGQDTRAIYIVQTRPLITSSDVVEAYPVESDGRVVIYGETSRDVADIRHVGGRVALMKDDSVWLSPAHVRQPIGRRFALTAPEGTTIMDAGLLSLFMQKGPLPAPLVIVDSPPGI